MSRVNLDTTDDVISFLRILAEESVNDARQSLVTSKMKKDEKTYGPLDEVDPPAEGDAPEEDVEVEDDVNVTIDEPEHDLEVSMDSISAAVNQLRSGSSVDDSEMKTQLRTYFDRLDGTEREALLVFLTAFSGILTRATTGQDAPDPSDPPSSITMRHGEGGEPPAGEEVEVEVEEEEEEEEVTGGEPADQPPIRAGAAGQSLQEIRKRVRALMNAR